MTTSIRWSRWDLAAFAATTSEDPSTSATTQSSTHRFRAIIAMRVLASPPEYASATRPRPWISCAIAVSRRWTKASTWRDDAMPSRAERLVAGEELRERLGELGLGQTNLLLRIPLADGDPFSFERLVVQDRKSTRLNSSHSQISYAVFCLKK